MVSFVAILAVLHIATGGFKYMTSEAVGEKGESRETIQGAVFGLVLLLGSWLILTTINPQILDLSTLRFEPLQPKQCAEGEGCAGDRINQIKGEREKAEARAKEFVAGMKEKINDSGVKTIENTIDITNMSFFEQQEFRSTCRSAGGTVAVYNVKYCYDHTGKQSGANADGIFTNGQRDVLLSTCGPFFREVGEGKQLDCYSAVKGD